MTGFDPDDYGGYEGEDDEFYAVENAYSEADRTSHPMKILLDVYKKYQQKDPVADRVAEDSEALQWLDDYWAYVRYNEHGNEGSVEDVGGFVGFARSFSDYAPEIAEYLLYDDINEIDGDARGLYERFIPIAQRYGGISKMKKSNNSYGFPDTLNIDGYALEGRDMGVYMRYESNWNATSSDEPKIIVDISPYAGRIMAQYSIMDDNEVTFSDYKVVENMDEAERVLSDFHSQSGMKKMKKSSIHDMIAQCRQNNNSLVKSRVDLKKFGPENPEDDFQREMASLGKILDASGVQFNLDVRDFPSGDYGYEIKFPTKEIGEQVFNEVADWGDEHGFYTWLQDDGSMSLTPN